MAIDFDRLKAALADRYTVEREIGQGGMAVVYLAEDLKHHRKVAIKVLRPELAATLGAERFLREIETAAKLNHPHILGLIDSGDADGYLYYVMPYVDGESLRQRLERDGQLPIEDALLIAREVADGLGYAHRHGLVHRDIKPGNILLSEDHAVISDFGIAKAIAEAGGERVTETGLALGSPTYMSPEQSTGDEQIDVRSDIYSLGCVIFEMLAGVPPFTGHSYQAVLAQQLLQPVPSLCSLRPEVPTAVDAVIAKSLARSKADRFESAGQMSSALSSAGDQPPPHRRRFGPQRRVIFGRKQCRTCQSWLADSVRVCPQCGRDQRAWYKRPVLVVGVIGIITGIPLAVAMLSDLLPEEANIVYAAEYLGQGRLEIPLPARTYADFVWIPFCDQSPCDNEDAIAVNLLELDSAATRLRNQVIQVVPRVDAARICLRNSSNVPTDSVLMQVRVPGWLIGARIEELVTQKREDGVVQLNVVRGKQLPTQVGTTGFEIQRAGLGGGRRIEVIVHWLPFLEDPLSWSEQLPLEDLARYIPYARSRDDSLQVRVSEGGLAGDLAPSRRESCAGLW